jgi:hypothetical protein
MKTMKKQKKCLPEVHILGDLQDVKHLITRLNRKKTIVVFHDGEKDSLYLEIEGKFQLIRMKDVKHLEKEYKLIYFSFFPGQKRVVPPAEEQPAVIEPENRENPEPEKEKPQEKATKKPKTDGKEKKEKKEKKVEKAKKKKK